MSKCQNMTTPEQIKSRLQAAVQGAAMGFKGFKDKSIRIERDMSNLDESYDSLNDSEKKAFYDFLKSRIEDRFKIISGLTDFSEIIFDPKNKDVTDAISNMPNCIKEVMLNARASFAVANYTAKEVDLTDAFDDKEASLGLRKTYKPDYKEMAIPANRSEWSRHRFENAFMAEAVFRQLMSFNVVLKNTIFDPGKGVVAKTHHDPMKNTVNTNLQQAKYTIFKSLFGSFMARHNTDDVVAVLKKYGIPVSDEELSTFIDYFKDKAPAHFSELKEIGSLNLIFRPMIAIMEDSFTKFKYKGDSVRRKPNGNELNSIAKKYYNSHKTETDEEKNKLFSFYVRFVTLADFDYLISTDEQFSQVIERNYGDTHFSTSLNLYKIKGQTESNDIAWNSEDRHDALAGMNDIAKYFLSNIPMLDASGNQLNRFISNKDVTAYLTKIKAYGAMSGPTSLRDLLDSNSGTGTRYERAIAKTLLAYIFDEKQISKTIKSIASSNDREARNLLMLFYNTFTSITEKQNLAIHNYSGAMSAEVLTSGGKQNIGAAMYNRANTLIGLIAEGAEDAGLERKKIGIFLERIKEKGCEESDIFKALDHFTGLNVKSSTFSSTIYEQMADHTNNPKETLRKITIAIGESVINENSKKAAKSFGELEQLARYALNEVPDSQVANLQGTKDAKYVNYSYGTAVGAIISTRMNDLFNENTGVSILDGNLFYDKKSPLKGIYIKSSVKKNSDIKENSKTSPIEHHIVNFEFGFIDRLLGDPDRNELLIDPTNYSDKKPNPMLGLNLNILKKTIEVDGRNVEVFKTIGEVKAEFIKRKNAHYQGLSKNIGISYNKVFEYAAADLNLKGNTLNYINTDQQGSSILSEVNSIAEDNFKKIAEAFNKRNPNIGRTLSPYEVFTHYMSMSGVSMSNFVYFQDNGKSASLRVKDQLLINATLFENPASVSQFLEKNLLYNKNNLSSIGYDSFTDEDIAEKIKSSSNELNQITGSKIFTSDFNDSMKERAKDTLLDYYFYAWNMVSNSFLDGVVGESTNQSSKDYVFDGKTEDILNEVRTSKKLSAGTIDFINSFNSVLWVAQTKRNNALTAQMEKYSVGAYHGIDDAINIAHCEDLIGTVKAIGLPTDEGNVTAWDGASLGLMHHLIRLRRSMGGQFTNSGGVDQKSFYGCYDPKTGCYTQIKHNMFSLTRGVIKASRGSAMSAEVIYKKAYGAVSLDGIDITKLRMDGWIVKKGVIPNSVVFDDLYMMMPNGHIVKIDSLHKLDGSENPKNKNKYRVEMTNLSKDGDNVIKKEVDINNMFDLIKVLGFDSSLSLTTDRTEYQEGELYFKESHSSFEAFVDFEDNVLHSENGIAVDDSHTLLKHIPKDDININIILSRYAELYGGPLTAEEKKLNVFEVLQSRGVDRIFTSKVMQIAGNVESKFKDPGYKFLLTNSNIRKHQPLKGKALDMITTYGGCKTGHGAINRKDVFKDNLTEESDVVLGINQFAVTKMNVDNGGRQVTTEHDGEESGLSVPKQMLNSLVFGVRNDKAIKDLHVALGGLVKLSIDEYLSTEGEEYIAAEKERRIRSGRQHEITINNEQITNLVRKAIESSESEDSLLYSDLISKVMSEIFGDVSLDPILNTAVPKIASSISSKMAKFKFDGFMGVLQPAENMIQMVDMAPYNEGDEYFMLPYRSGNKASGEIKIPVGEGVMSSDVADAIEIMQGKIDDYKNALATSALNERAIGSINATINDLNAKIEFLSKLKRRELKNPELKISIKKGSVDHDVIENVFVETDNGLKNGDITPLFVKIDEIYGRKVASALANAYEKKRVKTKKDLLSFNADFINSNNLLRNTTSMLGSSNAINYIKELTGVLEKKGGRFTKKGSSILTDMHIVGSFNQAIGEFARLYSGVDAQAALSLYEITLSPDATAKVNSEKIKQFIGIYKKVMECESMSDASLIKLLFNKNLELDLDDLKNGKKPRVSDAINPTYWSDVTINNAEVIPGEIVISPLYRKEFGLMEGSSFLAASMDKDYIKERISKNMDRAILSEFITKKSGYKLQNNKYPVFVYSAHDALTVASMERMSSANYGFAKKAKVTKDIGKYFITDEYGNKVVPLSADFNPDRDTVIDLGSKGFAVIKALDKGQKLFGYAKKIKSEIGDSVMVNLNENSESFNHDKEAEAVYNSFQDARNVTCARTPGQHFQSSQYLRVVGWITDKDAAAWVPKATTLFAGSDFDVDKGNIVAASLNRNGMYEFWNPLASHNDINLSKRLPLPEVLDASSFINRYQESYDHKSVYSLWYKRINPLPDDEVNKKKFAISIDESSSESYYDISSDGQNKEFNERFAKINGKTIREIYDEYREEKNLAHDNEYLKNLWIEYFEENPTYLESLIISSEGAVLYDGKTLDDSPTAMILSEIINDHNKYNIDIIPIIENTIREAYDDLLDSSIKATEADLIVFLFRDFNNGEFDKKEFIDKVMEILPHNISKEFGLDNSDGISSTEIFVRLYEKMDTRKLGNNGALFYFLYAVNTMEPSAKGYKNAILKAKDEILKDPTVFSMSSSPMHADDFKAIANQNKDIEEYKSLTHQFSPLAPVHQHTFNMIGLDNISIAAVGLKAYSGLTNSINNSIIEIDRLLRKAETRNEKESSEYTKLAKEIYRSLKTNYSFNGKNYMFMGNTNMHKKMLDKRWDVVISESDRLSILKEAYKPDIAFLLSEIVTMSTDNAKMLYCSKINATRDSLKMYIAGTAMGIPLQELYDTINSPVMVAICEASNKNVFSGEGKGFDSIIYGIYKALHKYENKKLVKRAIDNDVAKELSDLIGKNITVSKDKKTLRIETKGISNNKKNTHKFPVSILDNIISLNKMSSNYSSCGQVFGINNGVKASLEDILKYDNMLTTSVDSNGINYNQIESFVLNCYKAHKEHKSPFEDKELMQTILKNNADFNILLAIATNENYCSQILAHFINKKAIVENSTKANMTVTLVEELKEQGVISAKGSLSSDKFQALNNFTRDVFIDMFLKSVPTKKHFYDSRNDEGKNIVKSFGLSSPKERREFVKYFNDVILEKLKETYPDNGFIQNLTKDTKTDRISGIDYEFVKPAISVTNSNNPNAVAIDQAFISNLKEISNDFIPDISVNEEGKQSARVGEVLLMYTFAINRDSSGATSWLKYYNHIVADKILNKKVKPSWNGSLVEKYINFTMQMKNADIKCVKTQGEPIATVDTSIIGNTEKNESAVMDFDVSALNTSMKISVKHHTGDDLVYTVPFSELMLKYNVLNTVNIYKGKSRGFDGDNVVDPIPDPYEGFGFEDNYVPDIDYVNGVEDSTWLHKPKYRVVNTYENRKLSSRVLEAFFKTDGTVTGDVEVKREEVSDYNELSSYCNALNNSRLTLKTKESRMTPDYKIDPFKAKPERFMNELIRNIKRLNPEIEINYVSNSEMNAITGVSNPLHITRGVMIGNAIYLNSDHANDGTVMHELGHIFMAMLKQRDPEAYARIISLSLESEDFEAKRELYPELSDEDIAEEVFVDSLSIALDGAMPIKKKGFFDYMKDAYNSFVNFFKDTMAILTGEDLRKVDAFDLAGANLLQLADFVGKSLVNNSVYDTANLLTNSDGFDAIVEQLQALGIFEYKC